MSPSALLSKLDLGRSFVARISAVAMGTAAGQGMTLAVTPALTRLYSPDEFGLLGLYISFVGFASVASCLRLEVAIASTASDAAAETLTRLSTILSFATAPLGALIFFVLWSQGYLGFSALPVWTVAAVLVGLIAMGVVVTHRYYLVRHEAFTPVAVTPIVQNLSRALLQLAGGWWGFGALGLIVGEVGGRVANATHLVAGVGRFRRRETVTPPDITRPGAKEVFVEHADYPKYALPSAMLDTAAMMMLTPLVALYYGAEVAGLFFLVQRAVSLPVSFIAASISDVFHARISRLAREDPAAAPGFFVKMSAILALLGGGLALTLVFIAPLVFEPLFGDEWAASGEMAARVAPWAGLQVMIVPLSRVVFVANAQRAKLGIDVVFFVAAIGSLAGAAALEASSLDAILALSSGFSFGYLLYFALLWYVVRRIPRMKRAE